MKWFRFGNRCDPLLDDALWIQQPSPNQAAYPTPNGAIDYYPGRNSARAAEHERTDIWKFLCIQKRRSKSMFENAARYHCPLWLYAMLHFVRLLRLASVHFYAQVHSSIYIYIHIIINITWVGDPGEPDLHITLNVLVFSIIIQDPKWPSGLNQNHQKTRCVRFYACTSPKRHACPTLLATNKQESYVQRYVYTYIYIYVYIIIYIYVHTL